MYYLGIDVHKRDSYIAVLDDDSDVVEEVRVKNANLDNFAQQYAGSEAAIEATAPSNAGAPKPHHNSRLSSL